MKRIFTVVFALVCVLLAQGQTVRFSMQLGASVPLGDFAKNDSDPQNGGFATTGFDLKFIGERVLSSNLVLGVNLGYNMFGVDEDALKKFINPTNPENVRTESQAFQNYNLQGRVGYDWNINEGALHVTPVLDAGLGIFNSAYYLFQDDGGTTYVRKGNSAMALLVTPGLDIMYMVNDFVGIKIYGNYQFANYKVDEQFSTIDSSTDVITYCTKQYKYNSLCVGIGATVTL
ncbi:MAG: transporter [Salibacteraceae bacterium]